MSEKRQRTRWMLLVFAGLLAATGLVTLVSRPKQIVFSNGSWITIRRVSYGRDFVYYREPLMRFMAMSRFTEEGWEWLRARVPAIGKRFTGVNCCFRSRTPTLVVFGDANLNADRGGFWEFVSVDGDGRESGPMETDLLDHPELYFGDKPRIGSGILATRENVMTEPRSVRVYEVNRKEGTRTLLATLGVSRGRDPLPK